MSVIVKGMKTPKSCYCCPFLACRADVCGVSNKIMIRDDWYNYRADGCPLVALPDKHGRLVGINDVWRAFTNAIMDESRTTGGDIRATSSEIWTVLRDVSTVLEAEGGEE